MNLLLLVLAQADQPAPTSSPQAPMGGHLFLALMLGLIVFMFMTARGQKKREKRQREQMHARMSKNDRVLTIGGVIGTIISVKDNEVVVKVDESTNTKMTFIKTAIQRIITDDADLSAERK